MEIHGYAVVSEDDCIADASGVMPDSLKTEAEWAFFQAGLDACDVVVLGRLSHKMTPNPKARRRLVLTSGVSGAARQSDGSVFWNPSAAPLSEALALFGVPVARIGVTGGQDVFDAFLNGPRRYTHFHLSRIAGLRLPGGRTVFSGLEAARITARDRLEQAGYRPGAERWLDPVSSVVTWRPFTRA